MHAPTPEGLERRAMFGKRKISQAIQSGTEAAKEKARTSRA